jgi:hypothetical protein
MKPSLNIDVVGYRTLHKQWRRSDMVTRVTELLDATTASLRLQLSELSELRRQVQELSFGPESQFSAVAAIAKAQRILEEVEPRYRSQKLLDRLGEIRSLSEVEADSDADRRKFLETCGKFAASTPPSITVLFSTSLDSTAIAHSGGNGNDGKGNGGGKA